MVALDRAKNLIRVNAVCPAWVRTPMMDRDLEKTPQLKAMIEAVVPLGRTAEPDEVAGTILLLCSPAAGYFNGTALLVDDGIILMVHHA